MKVLALCALTALIASTVNAENWGFHPGNLRKISFDGDHVCGTTIANDIWCGSEGEDQAEWKLVAGKLEQVNVWGDMYVGLGTNQQVLMSNSSSPGHWSDVSGFLTQSSTDGKEICGTTVDQDVWCGDIYRGQVNWRLVPGKFVQVIVVDGALLGRKANGEVMAGRSRGPPNWRSIQGSTTDISFDGAELCATTRYNDIWCTNEGIFSGTPNWRLVEGKVADIEINARNYAGIGPNGGLWFRSS